MPKRKVFFSGGSGDSERIAIVIDHFGIVLPRRPMRLPLILSVFLEMPKRKAFFFGGGDLGDRFAKKNCAYCPGSAAGRRGNSAIAKAYCVRAQGRPNAIAEALSPYRAARDRANGAVLPFGNRRRKKKKSEKHRFCAGNDALHL